MGQAFKELGYKRSELVGGVFARLVWAWQC